MASLSAVFQLVDNMSDKLEAIANTGSSMVETFDTAEAAANNAFDAMESGGKRAAQSTDGVASSMDSMSSGADAAASAAESAADKTDYWTDAVGNYNKSALEAIYSTEELVEKGYKTEDALTTAAAAAEKEAAAVESGTQAMSEFRQTIEEQESELDALQEAYMGVVLKTGEHSEAAQMLKGEIDDLSKTLDDNKKQLDELEEQSGKTGDEGVSAVEGIASALAAAGITATVKEIADAAYELVDSFSEAEKIVVNATGATGDALDGLGESMLNAFAQNDDSLEDTAAAVGEINTRMGYTGETLTEVTQMFMDFADITNGNAATSVKNLTQLMNQWNIDAEDLEITMDKLAYAGQVSGISVDTLSSQLTSNKAVLDQLGFSLDESIAMFANFELSGTQAASVMTGFRTALSNGTISSLEDLYAIFEQIESGEMDAAAAADVFGARAGSQIVNAVNQGALSLDGMVSSLESAGGTLESTAEAGESLSEKWEQASNDISTAFTTAIEPTLSEASAGLAGVASEVGDFLNEHPTVTKAITAIGVGLGVTAVAIAGVSAASLTAIPAVAALGTAISAAIWPITAIAAGIAAVTAAVLLLQDAFEDDLGATEGMTAATREQYYAIEDLNSEYEEACEKYGETSEEASRLRYQMDDLQASFDANAQTVEEFTSECDALVESHEELAQSYSEANASIDDEYTGTLALIQKLDDLANSTEQTAGTQTQMESIIDSLNETFPDLSLSIEDVTNNTAAMTEALRDAAEAQAEQEKYQESYDTYVELLKEQAELENQIAKAEENVRLEQERMEGMDDWTHFWTSGEWDDLETYQTELEELNAALEDNEAMQGECESAMEEYAESMEEAAKSTESAEEETVGFKDAVETAVTSVQEEMEELCEAYDEAYESARSSIDGQIGLFDEMETVTIGEQQEALAALNEEYEKACATYGETSDEAEALKDQMEELTTTIEDGVSVDEMQSAFESQLEYINLYTENLKKAQEYGLTDGLISSLSDGSEESATYLNEIITNIESLGASSEEAQQFVDDFNTSFEDVEAAKDEFSETVATMETDFDEKMTDIEGRLNTAIEEMNMEEDAAAAASATMDAYTQAIRAGAADAANAAAAAAAAVEAALNSTQGQYSLPHNLTSAVESASSVTGYASGTTDAEDVFVAGEEGPELIVGGGGSTVFPADETRQIINAVSKETRETESVYIPTAESQAESYGTSGSGTEKKVTLEIAGKGNIQVTGGSGDKETMVSFLYEYLKPVLSQILTEEIFEEGDDSYEY